MIKNILIIDDFNISNEMVSASLKEEGYNTFIAQKVSEALEILKLSKIDLIITDYYMPEMDGIDLLRMLRSTAEFKSLPVIILSSSNNQEVIDEAEVYNILAWLKKPLDYEKLKEIIKNN